MVNPLTYNGGCVMAMRGDGCVAIASDLRFGVQMQTVSMDFNKVYQIGPRLFVGFPGLATDTQTVFQRLQFRKNLYELRENRSIKPKTLSHMVGNLLYERRFGPYFVEPIVAGLDPITMETYISGSDLIGCPVEPEDFVVSGTCTEQMFGMCETLWRPNMNRDELFECISQAMLNAFDRDAASGWGCKVYIIESESITEHTVKARMD